jgi:branched-subunit amino acid aminotransferase/4-amino-4-deoxychorismate lyase
MKKLIKKLKKDVDKNINNPFLNLYKQFIVSIELGNNKIQNETYQKICNNYPTYAKGVQKIKKSLILSKHKDRCNHCKSQKYKCNGNIHVTCA